MKQSHVAQSSWRKNSETTNPKPIHNSWWSNQWVFKEGTSASLSSASLSCRFSLMLNNWYFESAHTFCHVVYIAPSFIHIIRFQYMFCKVYKDILKDPKIFTLFFNWNRVSHPCISDGSISKIFGPKYGVFSKLLHLSRF